MEVISTNSQLHGWPPTHPRAQLHESKSKLGIFEFALGRHSWDCCVKKSELELLHLCPSMGPLGLFYFYLNAKYKCNSFP